MQSGGKSRFRRMMEPLDLLGKPFGLRFNGRDSHKTVTGAVFTILSIICVVLYLVFKLSIYINYELNTISTLTKSMKLRDLAEKYDVEKYRILPLLKITWSSDPYMDYQLPETTWRFITPVVSIITSKAKENSMIFTHTSEYIPYILCLVGNEYWLCPDFEKLKNHPLLNFFNGKEAVTMILEIFPCTGRDDCVAQEVFERSIISSISYDLSIDISSKEQPLYAGRSVVKSSYLTSELRYIENINLQLTEIVDRVGFPRRDQSAGFTFQRTSDSTPTFKRPDGTSVTCPDTDYSTNGCQPYQSFIYIVGEYYTLYERNYKTLVEVLSDVGGLYSIVTLVFSSIFMLLKLAKPEVFIVEKVYKMKRKSQSMQYYFCCCRKKYQDQGKPPKKVEGVTFVSTEVYNAAVSAVTRHLDAVSLSKDILCIKFLAHYLLEEYQRAVLPFVSLQEDLNKQRSSSKENCVTNKLLTSPESPNQQQVELLTFGMDDPNNRNNDSSKLLMRMQTTVGDQFGRANNIDSALKVLGQRVKDERIDNITPESLHDKGFRVELRFDLDKLLIDSLRSNQLLAEHDSLKELQIVPPLPLTKWDVELEIPNEESPKRTTNL